MIACLAREDLCLYVAVLAAVLALRGAPWRRAAAIAGPGARRSSRVEVVVLFPRFRPSGFRHWEQFEEAGETAGRGARPLGLATAMVDHPQKRRSLLQPLTATGFIGLADPLSIALQVPNWGERFFSSYGTRWWGYHYGVPAAATALVGAILGWRRLRARGPRRPADGRLPRRLRAGHRAPAAVLDAGAARAPRAPQRAVPRRGRRTRWRPRTCAPPTPRCASSGSNPYLVVAAQDRLLPHLAGRRTILMLDRALEAEVIALQLNGATWPDGRPTWRRRVHAIAATGAYGVAFCEGQTVVLRRGASSVPCPSWDAFLAQGRASQDADAGHRQHRARDPGRARRPRPRAGWRQHAGGEEQVEPDEPQGREDGVDREPSIGTQDGERDHPQQVLRAERAVEGLERDEHGQEGGDELPARHPSDDHGVGGQEQRPWPPG